MWGSFTVWLGAGCHGLKSCNASFASVILVVEFKLAGTR